MYGNGNKGAAVHSITGADGNDADYYICNRADIQIKVKYVIQIINTCRGRVLPG